MDFRLVNQNESQFGKQPFPLSADQASTTLGDPTGATLGNQTGTTLGNQTGATLGNQTGSLLGNQGGTMFGNQAIIPFGNQTGYQGPSRYSNEAPVQASLPTSVSVNVTTVDPDNIQCNAKTVDVTLMVFELLLGLSIAKLTLDVPIYDKYLMLLCATAFLCAVSGITLLLASLCHNPPVSPFFLTFMTVELACFYLFFSMVTFSRQNVFDHKEAVTAASLGVLAGVVHLVHAVLSCGRQGYLENFKQLLEQQEC